jgi:hypothetical protein
MTADSIEQIKSTIAADVAALRAQGIVVLTIRDLPEGRIEVRVNSDRADTEQLLRERYGPKIVTQLAGVENRLAIGD